MNKQPEALRLADELEFHGRYGYEAEDVAAKRRVKRNTESATELRRLVAENQALNDALQYSMGCHREMSELAVRQRVRLDDMEVKLKAALCIPPQAKQDQLTNEQIDAIADAMPGGLEGFLKGWGWRQFARAVLESANNTK